MDGPHPRRGCACRLAEVDAARYGRRVRVVEVLVSVALAAVAWLALGAVPAMVPALAVAAVAPPLARIDLAEQRLPNRLVVPALLAGVVGLGLSWLVSGAPPLIPLLAGAIYAGVLFVFALFGGMGMGDVKLAAALGLASPTLTIALGSPLLAFLFGGVAAVIVLIRRGRRAHVAFGPFLLAGYFGALVVAAVVR
jgi:leader peptidase (prepilin peptidase)/N-methyltransferase